MGKSHFAISTGLTLSFLGMIDAHISIPVVAVAAVSSLLPDIDEPNSLIVSKAIPTSFIRLIKIFILGIAAYSLFFGSSMAPWNMIIAGLAVVINFVPTRNFRNAVMILLGLVLIMFGHTWIPWSYILGCLLIICALVPHRGLTHTVYGVLGWAALLYFSTYTYDPSIWIAGGSSYLLHLLADALTDHGIRPLPPFHFRLRLRLMSTGRFSGTVIETVCIGLTIVLLWYVFLHGSLSLSL